MADFRSVKMFPPSKCHSLLTRSFLHRATRVGVWAGMRPGNERGEHVNRTLPSLEVAGMTESVESGEDDREPTRENCFHLTGMGVADRSRVFIRFIPGGFRPNRRAASRSR